MIQDIEPCLRNEYHPEEHIADDSVCLSFEQGFVRAGKDFSLPVYSDIKDAVTDSVYLFSIGKRRFFLVNVCEDLLPECFELIRLRKFNGLAEAHDAFAAITGHHLYLWYRDTEFCGRCGTKLVHSKKERAMVCPSCGKISYPRIAPAIITAVCDGDKLLMTTYKGRDYTRLALIAGFTEIGETVEQTVHREVMEETGVKVKNLKYYKSQPWGMSGDLLMGFFAELDGDPTIRMDNEELSTAEWYSRDKIDFKNDGVSLTSEMIELFMNGGEPK